MKDLKEVSERIEGFIREQVGLAKSEGVVLGLSGGVDSAVVATLCARALGKDAVLALMMPTATTLKGEMKDAKDFAKELGIGQETVDLKQTVSALMKKLPKADRKAQGNLAARLRASVLYYYANSMNRLVVGTGNRSEYTIGYFTKHGDGACDIMPIGGLYKTEVFALAGYLGVPKKIIDKTPAAGLWKGQTDEGEIGMSYARLDAELRKIKVGETAEKKVAAMFKHSAHKRQTPRICEI